MKTTIVSTLKLKTFKTLSISILAGLITVLGITSFFQLINHNGIVGPIGTMLLWTFVLYRLIQVIIKLKSVSYDQSSVYYEKNGIEVQTPFEDIRNIEIKTLSGIYTINLFTKSQDGDKIHFKTSMWYPLNFKKQDEKVNELRDKIDDYKRKFSTQQGEQLASYSLS